MTTRYHGYTIGDKSNAGQDAALRIEMVNPNSGIPLVEAFHEEEGLLVIRNVEIRGHMRHQAKEHFDYRLDFDEIYREIRDMKPKQVFFCGR